MRTPHILYVDNSFETKKRNVVLLFNHDFEVVSVSNIKEAMGILRVVKVDMVICDMHLPDGDADHLLQTVKTSQSLAHLPVIVLSSNYDEGKKRELLKLGATDYLTKDEDPTVFVKMVKDLVNLHGEEYSETPSGISGQLAKLKIVDLIIHLVKDHGSGAITIDGSTLMEIHLRNGNIVHAKHGITIGKKALFRCLRVADAAYHFQMEDGPVEASVEGGLTELLEEARVSNEKLMANYHRLPHTNHRVRFANTDAINNTKLRAEARAALEICRKFPRIGAYVDRLNLPDIVCYEYLLTFLERGFLELVTESKPVKIVTDTDCDLPGVSDQLPIEVIPVRITIGKERFGPEPKDQDAIYLKKPKQLEQATLSFLEKESILDRYKALLPDYDCLSIFMASAVSGLFHRVQSMLAELTEEGVEGKQILANELTAIDSRSISIGLGLLVHYAASLAKQGMQLEPIEEHLQQAIASLHLIFAVNPERSFLLKKGNAPVLIAWDGNRFHESQRLAKGEDTGAVLLNHVERRIDGKAVTHLAVGHVRSLHAASLVKDRLAKQLKLRTASLVPIGPISGHRFGEGTLGVAFFQI